jgi:hypothetical protein
MTPIRGPSFVAIFTMARLARMVVAGLPHHVTQRGNRPESIFFGDSGDEITPVDCFVEPPVPAPVTPNLHPQHNFDL